MTLSQTISFFFLFVNFSVVTQGGRKRRGVFAAGWNPPLFDPLSALPYSFSLHFFPLPTKSFTLAWRGNTKGVFSRFFLIGCLTNWKFFAFSAIFSMCVSLRAHLYYFVQHISRFQHFSFGFKSFFGVAVRLFCDPIAHAYCLKNFFICYCGYFVQKIRFQGFWGRVKQSSKDATVSQCVKCIRSRRFWKAVEKHCCSRSLSVSARKPTPSDGAAGDIISSVTHAFVEKNIAKLEKESTALTGRWKYYRFLIGLILLGPVLWNDIYF